MAVGQVKRIFCNQPQPQANALSAPLRKYMKSYLRSTMTEDRLSGLAHTCTPIYRMRRLTHSYSQLAVVSLLSYSSAGVRLAVISPRAINLGLHGSYVQNKDIKLSYDKVIDIFSKSNRRLKLC